LSRLTAFFAPFAQALGGMGLLVVAILDSSFIPLPTATDAGILLLVAEHPGRWVYYAVMATAGSVGGCYILYALARKGGEAFLRKRFHERHLDRGTDIFRRYGLLAVVIPSILPPPMPFKIFVLLAGVSEVSPATFVLAATIGRGFRYGGEALLAHWYGRDAERFITRNLAQVSIWVAVVIAAGGLAYVLWRRRRAA
jgi:membrane protein YqaA with SNARE-associated domain